jgi:hypothetical protein
VKEAKLQVLLDSYAEKTEAVSFAALDLKSSLAVLLRAAREQRAVEAKIESMAGGASLVEYASALGSAMTDELAPETVAEIVSASEATLRALKKLRFSHFAAWVRGAEPMGDDSLDEE